MSRILAFLLILICPVMGHANAYLGQAASSSTQFVAGVTQSVTGVTNSTAYTSAHGLGIIPTFIITYYQCITAEFGYSVGDRVDTGNSTSNAVGDGYQVVYDSTNTKILVSTGTPILILNKATPGAFIAGTPANWAIVVVPYK